MSSRRARFGVAALFAVMLVMGARDGLCAVADTDRLVVVNGLAETLTLVDRAGDSVVNNLMTLGLAPNRIRYGGGLLLLVNSTSDDLWVIDPATFTTLRRVEFTDGENPWDVAYLRDTLCAVSLLIANQVALVNQSAGRILRRVPVGKSPQGLLAVGQRLWVANTGFDFDTYLYGQGTVSVVNVQTGTVAATIPVGTNPQALALSPDGTVHVLCTGNYVDRFGIVYLLDTATLTVVDSLLLGGSPGDLTIAPDGIGYIAAGGWADSGEVFRYNAISRTVLNGAADPWHTARGAMAVVPRLEGGAHVLCFSGDSLVEHDRNGTVARRWQVGDGPIHAAYITNRMPGDLNEDKQLTVQDVVELVECVFRGGAPPPRRGAADVNADCVCNVQDVVLLVNVVFRNGSGLYWGCKP
jgi:YVTN family beta-propeller protein